MGSEKITFASGSEQLAGFLHLQKPNSAPEALFLHGGGNSDSSRTAYLSSLLIDHDISSFSLDFSSHGKSSGMLSESSLHKRVIEAQSTFQFFPENQPKIIIASSMGGYVGLKLLEHLPKLETLVLFCPAIYDSKAYNISFDTKFSKIIREKESWRNTDIFAALENFSGKLFLYIGEDDEVIPKGVVELIDRHSPRTKSKQIKRYPDCPHQIHFWLEKHPEIASSIAQEIAKVH